MSYMGIFTGKKAVVIGGSGGIGRQISLKLAQCGASLVIQGAHDSEKFLSLVKEIKEKSSVEVKPIVHEFKAEKIWEVEKSILTNEVGSSDILCVCYGPFLQKKLDCMNMSDWCNISLLDYALAGFFTSTALSSMRMRKWGRVLLFGGTRTSSIEGFRTNAAYAGAKTGLCSLVKSIAKEYSQYGITGNAILPGFTDTEYLNERQKSELAQKMPSGRLLEPQKIAEMAINLMANPEMNGVLLNMDGGWTPSD